MLSEESHISKGLAEFQKGNLQAAQNICEQVLSVRPQEAEAHNLAGMIAHHRGDLARAIQCYQSAVALRPDAAGFHNNLGVSLNALGRVSEAIESFQRAAQLNPSSAQIQLNLGNAHQSLGQTEPAVEALKRAVALRPDHAEAHNSLGTSLYMAGNLDGSIAEFEKASSLRPDFASAWSNLGNVLRDVGRYDEAINVYRRAISIQVDHFDARKNRAILQLLLGDYANGFLEYEWRWKCGDAQLRRFDRPRWAGEDPAGKAVFVYEEQGYGDVIQFARYANVLADRGAKVILGCRPELARLMVCVSGVSQVVSAGQTLPPFDLHCPLLSLPLFCGTTSIADIPAAVPYIRLSDHVTTPWKQQFASAGAPRVGLCWAGNPQNRNDRYRSILLEKFAPLAAVGDIEFHSLQIGPAATQCRQLRGMSVKDHESDLRDFADTAALIDQLDLVISVDTAIAHLAGALDKPVWVLLPEAPDWRWLTDRTDSPWYPTARLFRVQRDWNQVMSEVAIQLGLWLQDFQRKPS